MRIRPVLDSEILLFRDISIKTFVDAFGAQNKASDLKIFIEESRAISKVEQEFRDPNSTLLFVESNEEVIGYMKVNEGASQTESFELNSMELERIYLVEGHQGRGYGKQMMSHFEQMAVTAGVDMIWLGVWKKNPRAVAFYERLGFEIFDEHDYLVGTDLQRDYLLRKMF